jgi:hypothetical protein
MRMPASSRSPGRAIVAKFQRTLLLTFDLLRLPAKERAGYFHRFKEPEWKDGWCSSLTPKGLWAGTRRIRQRAVDLPVFAEAPLRSASLLLLNTGSTYVSRVFLLELTESDADLLTQGDERASEGLIRLSDSFTSTDLESRIWPKDWDRAYILFLIPDSWPSSPEQVSARVADLWSQLNMPNMAPIPELTEGLLVLPGRVLPKAPHGFRVVWLNPPSDALEAAELVVPATLLDLVSFILYIQVAKDLTHRLRELPVGPAETGRWLQTKRPQLLERYMTEHFGDRHRILTEVLECTQDFRSLRKEMNQNRIALSLEGPLQDSWPEIVTNPYKFYFSKRFRIERQAVEEDFENVCSGVEKRSSLDAEYLRDLLNGQVAASNLALQQTIRRLTAVALIIGVLALIISFIPDKVRADLWRLLFGS